MTSLVWIVVAVVVIVAIAILGAVLSSRRPKLRELNDESRARYADTWRMIETRFVDQPRRAVEDADGLAVSIYRERGAHVDGDRRLPDELKRARDLARGDGRSESETDERGHTENLRRAMVAYQRIVDAAVGESTRRASEARRPEVI
ncbi:MAG TPA: hypothetical protein VF137_00890 [Candidatus Dormibacteraeota bacterium]